MAYFSVELAKKIRQQLKAEFPEIKFRVNRGPSNYHGALSVTIDSAPYDFIQTAYMQCSGHHFSENSKHHIGPNEETAPIKYIDVLNRILDIVNCENYDNSDIMTDYFDVGYYVHFYIGSWNRPFQYTGKVSEVVSE